MRLGIADKWDVVSVGDIFVVFMKIGKEASHAKSSRNVYRYIQVESCSAENKGKRTHEG